MSTKPAANLFHRFKLYVYKKRFEKLKSQYIFCFLDDELEKIKAKIVILQKHVTGLGEIGQPLQLEITQFLSEKNFGVVSQSSLLSDFISRRERKKIVSAERAAPKERS